MESIFFLMGIIRFLSIFITLFSDLEEIGRGKVGSLYGQMKLLSRVSIGITLHLESKEQFGKVCVLCRGVYCLHLVLHYCVLALRMSQSLFVKCMSQLIGDVFTI
jgi:hypothetical protein